MHLLRRGHQVKLGSRYSKPLPDWGPEVQVEKIKWSDESELVNSCAEIDIVIHAAGMSAHECTKNPVEALAFNGVSTARLAAASIKAGVKKYIFLSTAHVYASPLVGLINEKTCPHNLHPYATSHLAGENAVLGACQNSNMRGVIVRLSNVFGRPMSKEVNCWGLLVNDLCRQVVETNKLSLKTSGLQQRDFIGMTEACRTLVCLIENQNLSINHQIINLGSGQSRSVLEMARLIQERCIKVLGYMPELQIPNMGSNEENWDFKYTSDVLPALGINIQSSDMVPEIDELLSYCKSEFI